MVAVGVSTRSMSYICTSTLVSIVPESCHCQLVPGDGCHQVWSSSSTDRVTVGIKATGSRSGVLVGCADGTDVPDATLKQAARTKSENAMPITQTNGRSDKVIVFLDVAWFGLV